MDKRRSLNVHLFKELQISGESLSLIVSDGWRRARHPLAYDLVIDRLEYFNIHMLEALSCSSAGLGEGIEKLFNSVESLTRARIPQIKSVEHMYLEDCIPAVIQSRRLFLAWKLTNHSQEHEWLPKFHSNWLTPKGPQVTMLNQSMLPNEILVMGPPSMEELDISVIARSAARNYYNVVGICEELSDLDPAQESAVKIYDGDSLSLAVAWGPR
ncbi:hypothetical protein SELMODRAFT_428451 [Selaginella moellendorffii]|uniref:Uncharacterized protein n=1 Tax=Selaginella moellendorffii TaxID=88036 RepID=D8T2W3_SELML|nr:hypothetical protein SELMODRAFT_428451 [Selaginella moellendorffii]